MESSNQKPTEENIDFCLCGYCCEHFQGEKHLLLCKCPANNQRCRNCGYIRCLYTPCYKPVTNQDVTRVLNAAKEVAADCCLGVQCQKPGRDRQTEIECPNKGCFNQPHRGCLHSLLKSEKSTQTSYSFCELMEHKAGEEQKVSHLLGSYPPKKTLTTCSDDGVVPREEPMDTDVFDVPKFKEAEKKQSEEPMDTSETSVSSQVFYTHSDCVHYMYPADVNEASGSQGMD